MKRLSIIAFMFLCTGSAFAQDRVITKDGDVFEAYRIDIGDTYLYYTKEDKDDTVLQKIAKTDVLMVKKKDGTKIDVTEYAPASAPKPTAQAESNEQPGITQVKPDDLSAETKAANDALIKKINAPVEFDVKEKHQEDIGKKEATFGYACLGIAPNSVLCNEDIEVSMEIRRLYKASKKSPAGWDGGRYAYSLVSETPGIRFSIKNRTSKTLYLDLANTFYVTMGQSTCYYIPSSTTTSNTSSGGGSVNLGAITGALGIGGTVGTLANGVNVGGGSSNTTSNTTFSQRIIAIAPLSTVKLSPQYLFCNEEKDISTGLKYRLVKRMDRSYIYGIYANFSSESQAGTMMYGDHYVYNPENSPVKMSFFVAYSKTENSTSTNVLPSYFYLKDMLGYRYYSDNIKNNDILFLTIGITDNKRRDSFPKQ